jgi:hypothetical protein
MPMNAGSGGPNNLPIFGTSGGGGRNYGGDGSGSFYDKTLKVLDGINQYNPIANLWDVVSYTFTGQDRFGNNMTLTEGTFSALGVLPILKPATIVGSGAVKGGKYVVYQGLDAAGKVRYVGITRRDATIRFREHVNSSTAKSLLDYRVIEGANGLSKTGARVWEQGYINQYGLGKNGGQLLNEINSISPKYWWQYGIKP